VFHVKHFRSVNFSGRAASAPPAHDLRQIYDFKDPAPPKRTAPWLHLW